MLSIGRLTLKVNSEEGKFLAGLYWENVKTFSFLGVDR